jgi:anthranilate phosphoribosyltransferase
VWVVLGHGGLAELSLAGPSEVIEVDAGDVRRFSVQPEDFGLRTQNDAGFVVESSAQSAAIIRAVLQGERGAARDVVLLNAAAGLIVAGRAASFVQATQLAADAIDSGAAVGKLSLWAALTQTGQG